MIVFIDEYKYLLVLVRLLVLYCRVDLYSEGILYKEL